MKNKIFDKFPCPPVALAKEDHHTPFQAGSAFM